MRLTATLTVVSLMITSCVHTGVSDTSKCINYDVFGPRDHSCPQLGHDLCPFSTTEQQHQIKLNNL